MPTISITIDSALPAQRVLGLAVDFSEQRSTVFPAVEGEHISVHSLGAESADVTEGTGTGIGVNWERCRYEWSTSDAVIAIVEDSNVYAAGSRWELRAAPTDSGSHVEMTWVRRFRRSPRGALFGTAFRLVGRPMFRRYTRQIMANMEMVEAQASSA
jgi:hypothetical protein